MDDNEIFFTRHKERLLACLTDMSDAHLQAANALNELRACLLEHDHNRRSATEQDPRG